MKLKKKRKKREWVSVGETDGSTLSTKDDTSDCELISGCKTEASSSTNEAHSLLLSCLTVQHYDNLYKRGN